MRRIELKTTTFILFCMIFLTGCAGPFHYSTYKHDFENQNSQVRDNNRNYVLFSNFDIPQAEGRTVRRTDTRHIHLYDVTEDIDYIGTMPVTGFEGSSMMGIGSFIEYSAPIGRRIFMLVFANTSLISKDFKDYHVDFIETNVDINKRTFISVSLQHHGFSSHMMMSPLYGGGLLPYFTTIDFDDKQFNTCSTIQGDRDNIIANIDQYMIGQNINPKQKYFRNYCGFLANPRKFVLTINETGYDEFKKSKETILRLKNDNLENWRKSPKKNPIFPLIQPYLNSNNN